MQKESIIIEIMQTMHSITTIEGLVSAVLQKILFCPFCEYFINIEDDLKIHIIEDHSDKLISSVKKRVAIHEVDEDAKRIYICPHCYFAVGDSYPSSPNSKITSHVDEHLRLKKSKHEWPRLSFSTSNDKELIQKYIEGTAEIELFHCNICNESFGVSETFLKHLIHKHSDPKDETKKLIENCAKTFLKEKEASVQIVAPPTVIEGIEPPKLIDSPPPVTVSKPKPPILPGQTFSKTARSNEIYKGVISFPPRLKAAFSFTEQIKVLFRLDHEEILPYDKSKGLSGLKEWYLINAVEHGDKILFRLLNQNPANIKIWTEWEKHLNYIIKCPSEDFKWQYLPIRDCLLHIFAKLMRPAHYRELYAHISRHRDLAISSVIGTLSKYRGILFDHTGEGEWKILQEPTINIPLEKQQEQLPTFTIDLEKENKVWSIVKEIKEKDLVYKLLDRIHEDLSFDQICQKIADSYNINWHELRHTGFINVNDPRLKRLSNGHFALAKWFDEPQKPEPPITVSETAQEAMKPLPLKIKKAPSGFLKLFWNFCKRMWGLLTKRVSKE